MYEEARQKKFLVLLCTCDSEGLSQKELTRALLILTFKLNFYFPQNCAGTYYMRYKFFDLG